MKFYAVIDTNVIVSAALKNNSVPWLVVDEARYGDVIPVVSDEILAEYKEVLSRPKFKFSDETIMSFLDNLKARAAFVKPGYVEDVFPDPSDVVFYAVLMEKGKKTKRD